MGSALQEDIGWRGSTAIADGSKDFNGLPVLPNMVVQNRGKFFQENCDDVGLLCKLEWVKFDNDEPKV